MAVITLAKLLTCRRGLLFTMQVFNDLPGTGDLLSLFYLRNINNREEALAREKQIKSWKGGEAFKRLLRGM